ncbi:MAG: NUDIX domain-containing protein [Candidatus Iainarchaeum archaeon]|uniref:NUDIX domain-containing protein n=1 Tax=Candidatus Iainarchaeum sp. TaxID=3101447 RepID=A0A7T9I1X3_9ARCH|nr:MAG: NUDIX domain-containing protein [Candidatus Diapherotrites archaeon]
MSANYPYRPNVQMWVFNAEGKLLFNDESTKDEIYWKFPQGGVDAGETHLEAVARELREEVNITDYTIIAQAPFTHRYEWDERRQRDRKLRGQEQTFYLIHAHNPSQLRIGEPNIRSSEWMTFEQILAKMTIPNQIEITKKVWSVFQPMIEKEIQNAHRKRLLAEIHQYAIIVNEKKEVLWIRGVGGSKKLSFPGGTVEEGETLESALAREIMEETSLRVRVGKIMATAILNDKKPAQLAIIYHATRPTGNVQLSHEHTDYQWIKPYMVNEAEVVHPDLLKLAKEAAESNAAVQKT